MRSSERRVVAVVVEAADLLAEIRVGLVVAQAGGGDHAAGPEEAQELGARVAAAHGLVDAAGEVVLQHRAGDASQRRERREAVDHRHVGEEPAHVVAAGFRIALAQHACEALRLLGRAPRAHQAACDLGGSHVRGRGIQRVAAEEVDLLQVREEVGTGVAARDALHLVDGQRLARVDAIGIELVAAVEMP
jgi:hypothetical protein